MSLERGWKPDPEKFFAGKQRRLWIRKDKCNVKAKTTRKEKHEHIRRQRIHHQKICRNELLIYQKEDDHG